MTHPKYKPAVFKRKRDQGSKTSIKSVKECSNPSTVYEGPTIKYKAGASLIKENEISRKMFIIKNGKARVFKNYMGHRVPLAILGEGEIFGELSFIDAEPRSASVEALTDLEVMVIDGEKGLKQIEGLPRWVLPVFRSVFKRFRELDNQITVFQSLNEYSKKVFKNDRLAQQIYGEIMRFLKTLKLLHVKEKEAQGEVKGKIIFAEMDDVLGNKNIGLNVFWKVLKEFDFVDHYKLEHDDIVILNQNLILEFEEFLKEEVQSRRYLLLSHSSLALLRRIVGYFDGVPHNQQEAQEVALPFSDINIKTIPLFEEALDELSRKKIIKFNKGSLFIDPKNSFKTFIFQSFIKSFDHSIAYFDA